MVQDEEDSSSGSERDRSGSINSQDTATTEASPTAILELTTTAATAAIPRAKAAQKRNRDFHALFKSVPADDNLIEECVCALQKEILLQGRFYISERHICFHSNIFGWINTLVISFDEIVGIEKKSTAVVFPNAIVLQTLHTRYVFASFISRGAVYDTLVRIWSGAHSSSIVPGLQDARSDGSASREGSVRSSINDSTDATDVEDGRDIKDGGGPSSRSPPRSPRPATAVSQRKQQPANSMTTEIEFPGPATHAPTKCSDEDQHFEKPLCDELLPAPPGKVFALAFGPESHKFLQHFLAVDEKVIEIQIPDNGAWAPNGEGKQCRTYQYTRPLAGGLGPKQTRCIITETVETNNPEDHITIVSSTQTPDVPSGGVFIIKTRYCLMWAEGNQTRIVSNFTITWSGRSFLKGPIEKGASDGQLASSKSLLASLRRDLVPQKAGGKGPRKSRKGKAAETLKRASLLAAPAVNPVQPIAKADDSFLAPFMPIWDILSSLLSGTIGIAILTMIFTVIVIIWLRPAAKHETSMVRHHQRVEWMGEDNLWLWLEDRAGLPGGRERGAWDGAAGRRSGLGIEDEIWILEEKLLTLKRAVDKDS